MTFQTNATQLNSAQSGPGKINLPPWGQWDFIPAVEPQIYPWRPWYLIQTRRRGYQDPIVTAPTNPPFPGAAAFALGSVLISWVPGPPAPIVVHNVVPPISGPAIATPLFARVSREVNSWQPDVPTQVARNLSPSLIPPAPVPLFARAQREINNWLPDAPANIAKGINPALIPPTVVQNPPETRAAQQNFVATSWVDNTSVVIEISQATPVEIDTPPFMGGAQIPDGLLNTWLPADPLPQQTPKRIQGTVVATPVLISPRAPYFTPDAWLIVAGNLSPALLVSIPPFIGGARVPNEVQINWTVQAWGPYIAEQPFAPEVIVPPQSLPQNPPFMGGASLPDGFLITWLPSDPAFQTSPKFLPQPPVVNNPPFMGGAQIPEGLLSWWIPASPQPPIGTILTPPSGVVAQFIPSTQFQSAVYDAWAMSEPSIVFEYNADIWIPPFQPTPASVLGIIDWTWRPADPTPPRGITFTASGPAAQNPPFPGTKVSTEIRVAWLPPWPQPIVAPLLVQSGQAVTPPPVRGSVVPLEVLVQWIPSPPLPTLWPPFNARLAPVAPVPPPAYRPRLETAWDWLPPDPAFQVGARLTPLSNPIGSPLAGMEIPPPVLVWWSIPAPPQPQITPLLPQLPPAPQNPPFMGGAALPLPVTMWWNIPPPMFQVAITLRPPIAGPTPQNPPFMGGAKVPLPVLIYWIPPPPQPPIATQLSAGYNLAQPLQFDPNYLTWPPPRIQITKPTKRDFASWPPTRKTVTKPTD